MSNNLTKQIKINNIKRSFVLDFFLRNTIHVLYLLFSG